MWLMIGVISVVIIVCAFCVHASLDKRMVELAHLNALNIDKVLRSVGDANQDTEALRDEFSELKEFIAEKLEERAGVRRIDKEILAHIKLIGRAQYNIFEDSQNTWNTLHSYLTDLDLSGKYKYEWSTRDPEDSYEIFRKQARDSATYFLDGDKGFYENEK